MNKSIEDKKGTIGEITNADQKKCNELTHDFTNVVIQLSI